MEEAGFVDVKEIHHHWPINTWPTSKHEKEIGLWCRENLLDGLESISMAPMTRYLEMSEGEVRKVLECVEKEIIDRQIYAYIPV